MKKILASVFLFIALFGVFFTATYSLSPSIAYAQGAVTGGVNTGVGGAPKDSPLALENVNKNEGNGVIGWLFSAATYGLGFIAQQVFRFFALLTGLTGVMLNYAVDKTVLHMADTYSKVSTIDQAWRAVRDLGNMGFIFVLLYASIMTIFGIGNWKQVIKNIVIAGLLINFSLFFTKLVIDVSNLLALTVYNSIAPGALTDGVFNTGISSAFMKQMHLTSLWQISDLIGPNTLLTVGILGSVVCLIAAFIFFTITIMFLIRWVALILVIILSPIYFLAMVLPGLKSYRDQWSGTLIGQAFFAPIYFLMTWITLKVFQGLSVTVFPSGAAFGNLGNLNGVAGKVNYDTSLITTLFAFGTFVAFLIASLSVSKSWSNKSAKVITDFSKNVTARANDAFFGGVIGGTGRKVVGGLVGNNLAESNYFKDKASKGGFAGAGARLALYAGRKARSSSFDPRNASIPTNMVGDFIEGTAGRTKLGKKFGLNNVSPVLKTPINVGAIAAKQTGAGTGEKNGYIENRQASEKKVKERDKAYNDELKKGASVYQIDKAMQPGGVGAADPAIRKLIRNLSEDELNTLKTAHLTDRAFAEQLKPNQADIALKRLSGTEKTTFEANRMAGLTTAIAATDVGAARVSLNRLSSKELAALPMTTLSDITVMEALTVPMLRRYAVETEDPSDILILRGALLSHLPANNSVRNWLESPSGQDNFS